MQPDLNSNYVEVLQSLKEKIRQARRRAIFSVNTELLKIYWEIGATILAQQKQEGWGSKIYSPQGVPRDVSLYHRR
jgi:hypothetical protein